MKRNQKSKTLTLILPWNVYSATVSVSLKFLNIKLGCLWQRLLSSPLESLLLDNFLLDTGQNGFGMLPMSKLEHVIPAPASRLLGLAEFQPNLICYGVSGLKPGSSLSPQPEGWGYSPVVSMRDRVITPPFMAEIISAISMRLRGFTH